MICDPRKASELPDPDFWELTHLYFLVLPMHLVGTWHSRHVIELLGVLEGRAVVLNVEDVDTLVVIRPVCGQGFHVFATT